MKLLFISSGYLPHPTGNGNCVLMNGLLECFRSMGFEISVVPVSQRYTNPTEEQAHRKSLENEGIKIYDILPIKKVKSICRNDKLRMIFNQRNSDFFYSNDHSTKELREIIKNENIKVLLGYTWESAGIMANIQGPLKIVSIVDLIEDVTAIRWRGLMHYSYKKIPREFFNLLISRNQSDFAYKNLSTADIIIEHASQHAVKLQNKGFKNVHYIPHPLPLRKLERSSEKVKSKVTILISGSLKGIASRLGFEFFLDQLLPRIEKRKNDLKKEITFRIVGHGEILPSLKQRLLNAADVKFIGFVDNIEDEYKIADIILVNIPVSHGFRTRIAEAFSYGFCVVAHAANADGMPEIKDEINALTGTNPDEVADKLIRAINDDLLRERLGINAKNTFENDISVNSAVKKLSLILEQKGLNLKNKTLL